MKLKEEDRNALVSIRLKKAKETMAEVHGNIQLGYWRTAANRLYYACYFAVSALLVKNGITAHTHAGVITMLGLHFVKKGIISKEQGRFYKELFYLRQDGDYDDWFEIGEDDVIPFLEPAEKFIVEIEGIINKDIL